MLKEIASKNNVSRNDGQKCLLASEVTHPANVDGDCFETFQVSRNDTSGVFFVVRKCGMPQGYSVELNRQIIIGYN